MNQVWILKNSKDLLEYIQSKFLSSCNSIKTYDFSTLYTTIPHSKLKDRLKESAHLFLIENNGQRRYTYLLVLWRDISYFVKQSTLQKILWNLYHQNARLIFIDTIFVMLGGRVFQQTVNIPIGTNCASLLADLFLYPYEADFMQDHLKKNQKKLAWSFICTFRYINDVFSLNNYRFGDFVDRIYPIGVQIKDTTDTARSWPTLRNWQWGTIKNNTLRQKRLFQFIYCKLSAYM